VQIKHGFFAAFGSGGSYPVLLRKYLSLWLSWHMANSEHTFPDLFWKNVFRFHSLLSEGEERSDWFTYLSRAIRELDLPEWVFRELLQATSVSSTIKGSLALHASCVDYGFVESFARDPDDYVRACIAQHPKLPVSWLDELARDSYEWVRAGAAKNPNIPDHLIERLKRDGSPWVVEALSSNPRTPSSVLEYLLSNYPVKARSGVARNPKSPASLFPLLLEESDEQILVSVAKNSCCPIPILENLAHHKSRRVVNAVLSNPQCPVNVLSNLFNTGRLILFNSSSSCLGDLFFSIHDDSPNSLIVSMAASHPRCPTQIMASWAKSGSSFLRAAVARNPKASMEILASLCADSEKRVSEIASIRLLVRIAVERIGGGFVPPVSRESDCAMGKVFISLLPNLFSFFPGSRLGFLFENRSSALALAANAMTPEPVLWDLSHVIAEEGWGAIVDHPNSSDRIRQKIAGRLLIEQ